MSRSYKKPDAIAKSQRNAIAMRRLGENARCGTCDESLIAALIKDGGTIICAACRRRTKGHTTMDQHHVAGKANSPVTALVPVNHHRGILSEAQRDWPKKTLENPEGDPLLAASGCIRGFIDTLLYHIDELLRWIADMLEWLSEYLTKTLGPKWWMKAPLDQYTPKEKTGCRKPKRSK